MTTMGISTITNMAAGLHGAPLNHEEVLEVGQQVRADLARWVRALAEAA